MFSCSVMSDPMDYSLPGSSVHEIFQPRTSKNPGVCCHSLLPGDLPSPRTEPLSPALASRFLTIEPAGKRLGFMTSCIINPIKLELIKTYPKH